MRHRVTVDGSEYTTVLTIDLKQNLGNGLPWHRITCINEFSPNTFEDLLNWNSNPVISIGTDDTAGDNWRSHSALQG